jgi:hypothetical protein
VLYGCETLFLTSRIERRLKGFDNVMLRKIFGTEKQRRRRRMENIA